jgi:hypothetical protein
MIKGLKKKWVKIERLMADDPETWKELEIRKLVAHSVEALQVAIQTYCDFAGIENARIVAEMVFRSNRGRVEGNDHTYRFIVH